jgi:hypothetical protein
MGAMPSGPAAALARGLAVFPIPPGQRKAPPGWQIRASADPSQPWPTGSNIGVGCRASGVVVLDLDCKNGVDGIAALERLRIEQGGQWPETFTVATAHGGRHLYFTAPPGHVVINTIGRIGPGIDVRAPGRTSGGYVVGPGSVVDGRAYVIDTDLPIASLPGWLLRLLRPAQPRLRLGAKTGDVRATVDRTSARR